MQFRIMNPGEVVVAAVAAVRAAHAEGEALAHAEAAHAEGEALAHAEAAHAETAEAEAEAAEVHAEAAEVQAHAEAEAVREGRQKMDESVRFDYLAARVAPDVVLKVEV